MFELWRALPWPAPLPGLQSVRTLGRTGRELSGLRNRHPARRSARTGDGSTILIPGPEKGRDMTPCAHRAWTTPSWVALMTLPAGYDGAPSPTIQVSAL